MRQDMEPNDDKTQTHVVLTKGTQVSHYQIVEKIDAGGMGQVYLAEDTKLNRKVALKFLPPHLCQDEDCRARFKREAQAAAKLNHPNIVTIHEVSEYQGRPYFAMQHVEGQSLREYAKAREVPIDKVINLAIQICDGLGAAHEKKVIHRDIKPSNIVIDAYGRPKILDFGLAAIQGSEHLTKTGSTLGTVGYMSPEQARGQTTDHRSDLFSLGVVIYEMVTGRRPFKGEDEAATLHAVTHDTPQPLARYCSDATVDLQRVVFKLLEKDSGLRYQSASGLLSDLKKLKKELESGPSMARRKPSIAVLPFTNLSADAEQEYFCDGMAEEIINALTHVESLRVVARTSCFAFKGKSEDIREIGRKLNVETLLEGSVRKAGNKLRVTAQLVNVADGYHLWSERYDRTMEDVFAIQDEISLAIVEELKVKLLGKEKAKLVMRHTEDLDAYSQYLKGRWFWEKRTLEGLKKAIEYFKQAIEKDADYALAYAGLADSYTTLPDYSSFPPKDAYPRAKEAALKALEIDGRLVEAHTSMAHVKVLYEWDWEGAEREFKGAIGLNPGYATAHHWYAIHLANLARFDEAIREMKLALEVDSLSLVINRNFGDLYYFARRFSEAEEALQKTIEMDPNFPAAHLVLGQVFLQESMYEKALAEFQEELRVSGGSDLNAETSLGIPYAKMGKRGKAQEVLNDLIGRSKRQYVQPYLLARLCFALAENDQAFEWLDKGYEEYDSRIRYLKIDPLCDSVRSDPRFTALLKKIGLE